MPDIKRPADYNPTAKTCVGHFFKPTLLPHFDLRTQADICEFDVRMAPAAAGWPPAALLDAGYAAAVMRHFGVNTKVAAEHCHSWADLPYPGDGPETSVEGKTSRLPQ